MPDQYWRVIISYLGFALAATLLALVRRWVRPKETRSDVWKKYPLYVSFNLIFLAAIWLPPGWHVFGALLAIIGGCAAWELSRALDLSLVERTGLPIATASLTLSADYLEPVSFLTLWLTILLAALVFSKLARHPDPQAASRGLVGLAGCLGYLPGCLATFLWVRQTGDGGFSAVFYYGVIATNDAMAQITGQLIGRRPLALAISPGKTLEGAAGGLLFAILFGLSLATTVGWSDPRAGAIAALVALAGLSGDLLASSWKRALGLKDFGTLLGPHGGVLDRFDALIFAAPLFFLLAGR